MPMNNELEKRLIALREAMSGFDDQTFLDAVDAVVNLGDEQAMGELLLLLHSEEDYELYDWMSTIMHAAESIGTSGQYTFSVLQNISSVKEQSAHWAERLINRLLNDTDCFHQLLQSAGTTSEKNRVAIRAVASIIEKEREELGKRAEQLADAFA